MSGLLRIVRPLQRRGFHFTTPKRHYPYLRHVANEYLFGRGEAEWRIVDFQIRRKSDVSHRGSESENPVIASPTPKRVRPRTNKDWWPNQLDLSILHQQSPLSNPMGEDFNYKKRSRRWTSRR